MEPYSWSSVKCASCRWSSMLFGIIPLSCVSDSTLPTVIIWKYKESIAKLLSTHLDGMGIEEHEEMKLVSLGFQLRRSSTISSHTRYVEVLVIDHLMFFSLLHWCWIVNRSDRLGKIEQCQYTYMEERASV